MGHDHLSPQPLKLIYIISYPAYKTQVKIYFSDEELREIRVNNQYFGDRLSASSEINLNPYPTAFPYGNGMVLHFYQQQESSTTKTVHKVINKGLKAYV